MTTSQSAGENDPEFDSALNAVVSHLESLQARGVRSIPISQATLQALAAMASSATQTLRSPQTQTPPSAPGPIPYANPLPASEPVAPPAMRSSPVPEVLSTPFPEKLQGQERVRAMEALRAKATACVKCPHLAASRKQVVFGVGDVFSPVLFVGEAPGADEDEAGEPFVGRAGQLLTKIIETMGFSRQTVYIANILKCRPDMPGQTSGNRKPRPEEMKTCLPYLQAQIDLIQPQVMVALGATAVEGLLGNPAGISKLRGHWQSFRGIPVMPTYHPAYLLRNMALSERRKVWEDMLLVLEKLGRPISEKQRSYFLPSSAVSSSGNFGG